MRKKRFSRILKNGTRFPGWSRRKKSRNLAEDRVWIGAHEKSAAIVVARKFQDPSIFTVRSRVRVSECLSGRCCRIFGMRCTDNPSLASQSSYIAPRPWRAARDPWSPRKGHRQGGEQRRIVEGAREAARSGTWHTYCLPFGNLEPKGFSPCFCRERRSMIEKLIFQIKSLIRARGFLAKITATDSDDGARGICEESHLLSRSHRESVSLFSSQSREGEKRNGIK